jgi:malonate-semialdehyde dehydrogenase (acetylating)/methylmalonate-semialdehyde dehydrogenase
MERDLDELAWLVSHENGKTSPRARATCSRASSASSSAPRSPTWPQGEQLDVSRGINCERQLRAPRRRRRDRPLQLPRHGPAVDDPAGARRREHLHPQALRARPLRRDEARQPADEAGLRRRRLQRRQRRQAAVEAIVDHPDDQGRRLRRLHPGRRLLYARGTALGKRMLCLGGAKNHLLVVPDADLELTATTVVASAFGCAGQRCMAASVMIAVGDVQPIIDAIVAITRKIRSARHGPRHQPRRRRAHHPLHRRGREARGAKVLVDGRGAAVDGEPGYWVGPTLLDHVTPDMPAGCEEIFGPVLSIVRAAPSTRPSRSRTRAPTATPPRSSPERRVARYCLERFEAGMCGVNVGVPVPREPFAFGGWNDSKFGVGDLTGWDGYRFWTRPRKVTSRWAQQRDMTWKTMIDCASSTPSTRGRQTGAPSTRCPSPAPRACTSTRPRASASSTSTASS